MSQKKFPSAENDSWTIGEADRDGFHYVIRFRDELITYSDSSKYTERLSIIWEIEDTNEHMLPSQAEMDSMDDFENQIVPAFEKDELATLAFTILGKGEKEWVFYAKDNMPLLEERLNSLGSPDTSWPIRISIENDPEWSALRDIIKGLEVEA